MIGRVIWSQDFGAKCWKFFKLFPGSPGLCRDLIMIPGLRSSGFVVCYDVTMIWCRMEPKMVHGHEGTKRCPVLYGFKIWVILCVIVEKINKMLLCVMLICTCLMY